MRKSEMFKTLYLTIEGKKYMAQTMVYHNKQGDRECNTIFVDWYLNKINFKKTFPEIKTGEPNKQIEQAFYKLKLQLEKEHPNILVLIEPPIKFVNNNFVGGIPICLTIYIPKTVIFDKSNPLPAYKEEIEYIITDINSSIYNFLEKKLEKVCN